MFTTTLLLAALTLTAATPEFEPLPYEAPLQAAVEATLGCGPDAFDALFALVDDARMHGVHPGEELAAANEQTFLGCPRQFMHALDAQTPERQAGVARHFGLQVEPWVLGAVLAKLREDPALRALIEREFAQFLEAEPDFGG